MIWLPGTTDNSTHFAQSLEIRGIESRLYLFTLACIQYVVMIRLSENVRLKTEQV